MRARQLALQFHGKRQALAHERIDLAQPRVRREQHEGAAAATIEALFDDRRRFARKIVGLRIEFGRRDDRAALAARSRTATARSALARRSTPSDRLRKSKLPSIGDRRAGEHDALRARKERRAQELRDVEGRAVDFVAAVAFAALDPGDRFVGRQLRAIDRALMRENRAHRQIAAAFGLGVVLDPLLQAPSASWRRASSRACRASRARVSSAGHASSLAPSG